MASTIPFSTVVTVNPSVLSAGGDAVDLNGVMLTQNAMAPYGTVLDFSSASDVGDYFGETSTEYSLATIYFNGYTNCTNKPGTLYFVQYPESAIAAWISSGSMSDVSLTTLQSYSGAFYISVDGYVRSSSDINLSSATSYSAAAALIQSALNTSLATEASFTASISGTTLTVSNVSSGTLSVGQTVVGSGVASGTIITALGTGEGLTGTYTVNTSQTVSSESMTTEPTPLTVSYNSTGNKFYITSGITGSASTIGDASGALATDLLFTSSTGATTSQGADATTPSTFMGNFIKNNQNWACVMTLWESSLSEKEAFATWSNSNAPRYLYVCQDSDSNIASTANSTEVFGYYLSENEMVGTCPIYGDNTHAAFVLAYAASLDFNKKNGRATLCFRSQSGLSAYVTDSSTATNVKSNGYNYYGAFGSNNPANNQNWMTPGSVSGDWDWADTYLNQIWLNANLQLDLITLLVDYGSIPYNSTGYSLVSSSMTDTLNTAINFGAIRTGVTLSSTQKSEIQQAIGSDVSSTISSSGYYLSVTDPGATVRAERGSPNCTLYYADGGSIQTITLSSIAVQ